MNHDPYTTLSQDRNGAPMIPPFTLLPHERKPWFRTRRRGPSFKHAASRRKVRCACGTVASVPVVKGDLCPGCRRHPGRVAA